MMLSIINVQKDSTHEEKRRNPFGIMARNFWADYRPAPRFSPSIAETQISLTQAPENREKGDL
jgi:hypothetical protein